MNFVNKAQLTAPAAADGVVLTSSGVAWGNPAAFTTILASAPSACILSGIILRPTFANGGNNWDNEIDIATGGVGSEVVISTLRYTYCDSFGASTTSNNGAHVLPIGIDNIANNARISARMRSNTASAFTCAVSIQYYSKPVSGQNTYLTTSQPLVSIPFSTISPTLSVPDTIFTNSGYVQIRAAGGLALVLLGITVSANNGGASTNEIDLATGAALSEVVIATVHFRSDNLSFVWIPFPTPLDNIAAGVRIAARIRGNVVGTLRIGLIAIEKPL